MSTYRAKIERYGNGLGLRLPDDVVRLIGLSDGSEIELEVSGAQLVLKRARKLTLDEMFRGKTDAEWRAAYQECDFDWGPDVGREIVKK